MGRDKLWWAYLVRSHFVFQLAFKNMEMLIVNIFGLDRLWPLLFSCGKSYSLFKIPEFLSEEAC